MQLFFLIEPGPYFILNPDIFFGGEHEHFVRKEHFVLLIFLRDIENGLHMLHFSKR